MIDDDEEQSLDAQAGRCRGVLHNGADAPVRGASLPAYDGYVRRVTPAGGALVEFAPWEDSKAGQTMWVGYHMIDH